MYPSHTTDPRLYASEIRSTASVIFLISIILCLTCLMILITSLYIYIIIIIIIIFGVVWYDPVYNVVIVIAVEYELVIVVIVLSSNTRVPQSYDGSPFICKSIYIQTTQHIIYKIHTICIYVHITLIFRLPVYMPPRSAAPKTKHMC